MFAPLLLLSSAFAASPPVLPIEPLRGADVSEEAAEKVSAKLIEACRDAGVPLVRDEERAAFLQRGELPARERLSEAREALREGRAAYARLELDEAERKLGAARDQLAASLVDEGALPLLTQAALYLATTHLARGDVARARETLVRLLILAPEQRADEDEFSPELLDLLEQSRVAVRALPRRSLTVVSDPPLADVRANGVRVGTTPVQVSVVEGATLTVEVMKDGSTGIVRTLPSEQVAGELRLTLAPRRLEESVQRFSARMREGADLATATEAAAEVASEGAGLLVAALERGSFEGDLVEGDEDAQRAASGLRVSALLATEGSVRRAWSTVSATFDNLERAAAGLCEALVTGPLEPAPFVDAGGPAVTPPELSRLALGYAPPPEDVPMPIWPFVVTGTATALVVGVVTGTVLLLAFPPEVERGPDRVRFGIKVLQ